MNEAKTSPIVAVAPMMDWTDRHCRYFLRQLSPDTLLYTEMVTAAALIHGDAQRFLAFDPDEHPVALQLGGSDPKLLADAAVLGEQAGYDEINLNIGCPSERVQSGSFGACLMAEPDLVAVCVAAMRDRVRVRVTVKSRIGIDDHDDYAFLHRFVETVAGAGCDLFVIHARKAILSGLSPKQNRQVPPLRYDFVYRIKQDFPHLMIVVNGGINDLDSVTAHLQNLDGVMIGRHAYHDPYWLCQAQLALFPERIWEPPTRSEILARMSDYLDRCVANGVRPHSVTRHMMGLFAGQPGAKRWRRYLSEQAQTRGHNPGVLRAAAADFV